MRELDSGYDIGTAAAAAAAPFAGESAFDPAGTAAALQKWRQTRARRLNGPVGRRRRWRRSVAANAAAAERVQRFDGGDKWPTNEQPPPLLVAFAAPLRPASSCADGYRLKTIAIKTRFSKKDKNKTSQAPKVR